MVFTAIVCVFCLQHDAHNLDQKMSNTVLFDNTLRRQLILQYSVTIIADEKDYTSDRQTSEKRSREMKEPGVFTSVKSSTYSFGHPARRRC